MLVYYGVWCDGGVVTWYYGVWCDGEVVTWYCGVWCDGGVIQPSPPSQHTP